MPYVLRGPDGKIDAIFQSPREGADEELQPDDPILAPQLRKRAAQAYAYSLKAVTRDPLALGVIFDNDS